MANLSLFEQLGQWLTEERWSPIIDQQQSNTYTFAVEGEVTDMNCSVALAEAEQMVICTILPEAKVENEAIQPVTDFLNRVNDYCRLPGFSIEAESGQIKYRQVIIYHGMVLTKEAVAECVDTALDNIEEWTAYIYRVSDKELTPKAAMQEYIDFKQLEDEGWRKIK